MRQTIAIALMGLLGACAVHQPRTVFRAGVFIDERGISVPLPPPSLTDAPKQDVEVEGQVTGDEAIPEGTVVHVVDNVGGSESKAVLEPGASRFVADLFVDLQDNCLEVWLETPDGRASAEPALFHTAITDDDEIAVAPGC